MQNLEEQQYKSPDGYELPTVSGQADKAAPVYENLKKSPDGTVISNRCLLVALIICTVILVVCMITVTVVIVVTTGGPQITNGKFHFIQKHYHIVAGIKCVRESRPIMFYIICRPYMYM